MLSSDYLYTKHLIRHVEANKMERDNSLRTFYIIASVSTQIGDKSSLLKCARISLGALVSTYLGI